jgi:hypothetical protein
MTTRAAASREVVHVGIEPLTFSLRSAPRPDRCTFGSRHAGRGETQSTTGRVSVWPEPDSIRTATPSIPPR